ncbi:unnamed protein product [Thlaspi arvense]|uniref:Uncharacterized protein n=1 Tax=Thlaspi arvense TaxID=13288 RepID=A0AAU9TAZ6_THLAR|nr:unnamed protein product [Thlaspi arvense]
MNTQDKHQGQKHNQQTSLNPYLTSTKEQTWPTFWRKNLQGNTISNGLKSHQNKERRLPTNSRHLLC